MFNRKNKCRLCESTSVNLVLKMPASPPVDNFRKLEEKELSSSWFPMDLYMCENCKHVQLLDVVSPDLLYGNYIYTSSSSPDLDQHFTYYANHVIERFKLKESTWVLDIGSNDGLFLSKFKKTGINVLGIDPSRYVASLAEKIGIPTQVGFFNHELSAKIKETYGKMDIVTANNVFSHADNLKEFATAVHSLLKENGVFIFEVSYLKDMIDNFVLDYVYHEHLCYHSILPLNQFLNSCQLKLIDVEKIPTKGGSIRCYAVKSTSNQNPLPIVNQMIAEEKQSQLYETTTYEKLEQEVKKIRTSLLMLVQDELIKGNRIAAYGASATSTVLNLMLGLSDLISFIVDDNEKRQQRFSPGHLIPILSSTELLHYMPSVTIISAWRFAKDIIDKNQKYKKAGGRFIIPFPTLRIG